MSITCSSCFASGLDDNAKYCPVCGFSITGEEGAVTCGGCGRLYQASYGSCPYCSSNEMFLASGDTVYSDNDDKIFEMTSSEGEMPLSLTYSNYRGHELSVKPDSVDFVCSYLKSDVWNQLDEMAEEVNDVYKNVSDYAAEPITVSVPSDFDKDKSNAIKAIDTAKDEVVAAAEQVYNIADAIRQYGEGGWNTSASVLKYLNDFIGYGSNPSSLGGDGDPGGDVLEDSDSVTDDILDMDANEEAIDTSSDIIGDYSSGDLNSTDEEIVISSSGSDSIGTGSYVTPSIIEDKDSLTEEISDGSDLTSSVSESGYSAFAVPSPATGNITETKSSSVLSAVGLAAAAAVALGGKIYYDAKHEGEDDDGEDDNDNESSQRDLFADTSFTKANTQTNLSMLDMKKKLFGIGVGGDN